VRRDARGRVTGVVVEDGERRAREVSARIVIGADGLGSPVAKRVGAEPYRTAPHASAVIYAFAQGLDVEGYHWHFGPRVSAGAIPTSGGDVLVFASMPRDRFVRQLRHDLPAGFVAVVDAAAPALGAAMRVVPHTAFRGFAGHHGIFRPAWGPGWALVGDAGYFKDPLTAHGITDALRDATLLARAVERGTDAALAEYQRVRDDLSLPLFGITDEIASFDWDMPRLQALHTSMSEEMSREVRYLRDLDEPQSRPTYAAAG
jgi:menaquinone-9 beta-reductase